MNVEEVISRGMEMCGGKAKLSELYKAIEGMTAFPSLKAESTDWKAVVRINLQRSKRFVRGTEKGSWMFSYFRAVESMRPRIEGIKVKRYRLRKEAVLLQYFELYGEGTSSSIVEFVNKDAKNKQGGKTVQASMSSREVGQILKRMNFVKVDGVWVPPISTKL